MSSVDESLAKVGQRRIFTKLDCKSGFWQIPLSPKSRRLITFITPFGRFCFNRLPFGISTASELFQRMMTEVLIDMESAIRHMDDIFVHAKDQPTLGKIVREVLQRLSDAGLSFNEKCEFSKNSAKYLEHIIDENGIHPDPNKVEAIKKIPAPSNVTELLRFMGMVNQLAKYIPQLADINTPLRQLLRKYNSGFGTNLKKQRFNRSKICLPPHRYWHTMVLKKQQSSLQILQTMVQEQFSHKSTKTEQENLYTKSQDPSLTQNKNTQ